MTAVNAVREMTIERWIRTIGEEMVIFILVVFSVNYFICNSKVPGLFRYSG